MSAELTNHLWQSTLFALAAAILAAALRANGAHIRHRVWLAASLKFLVPFSLLIGLGTHLAWPPAAASPIAAPAVPAVSVAVDQIAQPFSKAFPSAASPAAPASWTPGLLLSVWGCGFAAVVLMRLRGWRRVRAAVRDSTPMTLASATPQGPVPIRSSADVLEPGIVGLWRPILLMPADIEQYLTPAQLEAVLAHEWYHVRRRDNLTAAIHMVVEAVFWFHPGVWWIGARLVEERERACDQHVLRVCGRPDAYAESILNVCRRYVESPISCVSGVSGADLKKRIEDIMINRVGVRLTVARRILLAAAAIAAVALPFVAGVVTAPLRASVQTAGQQPAGPRFEVASIKPCERSDPSVPGGRSGGAGPRFSPGRFVFECGSVEMLISAAYVANGELLLNDAPRLTAGARQLETTAAFPQRIRGGPDWIRKERFTIEAKAEISTGLPGAQAPERKILMGPMLRTLLEERFQLKFHREIQEDVPMYALVVAPGGLKIKPVGPDGGCTPPVPGQGPRMDEEIALVRAGGKPICGHGIMGGIVGTNQALVLNGQTMSGVALALTGLVDRHVLDKTGVAGKFVLYLEYALDDMTPFNMAGADAPRPTEPPTGPTILTALREQLGLRLEPTKGPKGYIIIDRVERPTPDSPDTSRRSPDGHRLKQSD